MKETFRILDIFLNKKTNALSVCIHYKESDKFFVYIFGDNFFLTDIVESIAEEIITFREDDDCLLINSIDTFYFNKGGAIRMFATMNKGHYYIFLNKKHKYISKLFYMRESQLYEVRSLLEDKLGNVYLTKNHMIPKTEYFSDFIEYFIGRKK